MNNQNIITSDEEHLTLTSVSEIILDTDNYILVIND